MAQALAQRSRIVLECAKGHSIMEVSRRLRVGPGHGPHLATAIPGPWPGRLVRRAAARCPPEDH
ncbi:hypothetical protein T261_8310 [Streptomyces lydicus]|nr:hypothetical protein T261_8310 [Streptomyces lydicus]